MYPTSTMLDASDRIRRLWTEFESWAEAQRKLMDRRRDEISKAQDLKWKAVHIKTRAKQEEHDTQKAKLLREALDDYVGRVRVEWQARLTRNNLRHEHWSSMTPAESQNIERVLGDGEPSTPIAHNVVAQPQHLMSVPVPNPAPPLSSTARASNLSASTTSSYTLVNPNEFSTDDELFEAISSYRNTTDESEDEHISIPVPIAHSDGWGMESSWTAHAQASKHSPQNGSPDHLSSSSSSAYEYLSHHPALSRPEMNEAPRKRPPDSDHKGKSRVRGPTYIGPHLSSPEESSDEEDFELFKMQTRVEKIWEFHKAAAQMDAELTLVLHNDRGAKKATWKEYAAAKVAEHEKRILKLQAEKEEERKAIVSAERKKRREEIRQRSVLSNPARAANAASTINAPQDWQSTFKKSQIVRLDAEKNFFIGKDAASDAGENQACNTPHFEPSSDIRTPAPPGSHDTLRARRQSVGRATPSGWRTKQTQSTPTTSLSQWHGDPPAAPSPDPSTVPSWMEATFSGTSLDYSSSCEIDDFQLPGGFPGPSSSTPMPPIPSGWGPKKSTSTATSLLRQVLSDPTSTPMPTFGNNKNSPSPPTEAHPKAAPAVEPKHVPFVPAPISAAAAKKQAKKGRLAAQKKGSKADDDAAAESPTTPTLTAKPNPYLHAPSMAKDILQQRLAAQMDDELSSTPRPHLFAKRAAGGLMPDYSTDVASTPRASLRRLGDLPGTSSSSTLAASSWTMEAEQEVEHGNTPWARATRPSKASVPVKPVMVGGGWGELPAKVEMEEEEEEESPWERMQKLRAQGQIQPARLAPAEEETPWMRMQKLKLQGQVPPPKPALGMSQESAQRRAMAMAAMADMSNVEEEGSLWERQMKMQSAFAQRSTTASALSRSAVSAAPAEESLWNKVMAKGRLQAGEQHASVMTPASQQQAEPEEMPWERQMRLRSQGSLPNTTASSLSKSALDHSSASARMHSAAASWGGEMDYEPPISKLVQQQPPAATQPTSLYWTPNGGASHMKQASAMPGSYSAHLFDGQPVRRLSEPDSREFEYGDMPEDTSRFVPAGIMKSGKGKAFGAKRVMMEEVPDEEGPRGRKGPGERLPSNSRILLDIVEPKPSVPSTMFTNIIQFGEEEEEEEEYYDTGLSSTVPTPSTAPTSPPGEIPSLDDEEWLMEQVKNGEWDTLLKGGSIAADVPSKAQQAPRWPIESSVKKTTMSSQMVDSAQLYSALESMEPAAASPPKAAPPAKAAPSPKAAPPPKAAPAPAPAISKAAPAVVEKPEPAVKTGNQTKGKAKGKGKGRK